MTTLYTDGTFIINEKASDRAANIAAHGAVTNEYEPLSYDNPYEFANAGARPWHSNAYSIKSVKFGSPVKPTSTAYWFNLCNQMTSFDSTNLDTSNVTKMNNMFYGCSSFTSLDLSSFDTSNVINMDFMFCDCSNLTSLDLSSFDTSKLKRTSNMFYSCTKITTIYASTNFVVTQITDSYRMFYRCNSIVGGAGTTFSGTDKTYARIDNPPTAPGYFTAKP